MTTFMRFSKGGERESWSTTIKFWYILVLKTAKFNKTSANNSDAPNIWLPTQ